MPALTGDVTSTVNTVTTVVAKINGTTIGTNAAADQVIVTTASATWLLGRAFLTALILVGTILTTQQLPTLFSCGTSSSGGGGIADPGSNGILSRTALNTVAARTITGTTNRISITNGDGVSGNPTIDVGSNIVDKSAANTYTAGQKQTFGPNGTSAGLECRLGVR
jgi:hypothetical protein